MAKLAFVHSGMTKQWLGRFRKWSEIEAWGFVFSDSHCQHFFSLGETTGSHGDEILPKPRIRVFILFELYTDTVGLQSAKIVRRAPKEEVEHYFVGPRGTHTRLSTRTSPIAHESARGASRSLSARP